MKLNTINAIKQRLEDDVTEQILSLIDTEMPFRLLAWIEAIEGHKTAEKIYKHFEEKDEGADQWGYYSFAFLEEDDEERN